MGKQNRLFIHNGQVVLALLLMLACVLLPLDHAHAGESGTYKFQTPPDIFDPDFKDPYNFASLPYPFEEDPGWGFRVNKIFATGSDEPKYVRFMREAKVTGNPYGLLFVDVAFPRDNEFWMNWACNLSTGAWAHIKLCKDVRRQFNFSYYYNSSYPNPIDKNDPWALYELGGIDNIMRAAKAGLPVAMAEIANEYRSGKMDLEQDKVKAFYLAAEAARRGSGDGWRFLSHLYRTGVEGLFPPDPEMETAARRAGSFMGVLATYGSLEEAERAFPKAAPYGATKREETLSRSWAYKTWELQRQRLAKQKREKIDPLLPQLNREIDEFIMNNVKDYPDLEKMHKELETANGKQ